MNRHQILRQGLDIPSLCGVEIGPLADPVIGKSEGNILYVDHLSKADLVAKYAGSKTVDSSKIVDVDAIWGDHTILECLGGDRVDYVIASHVAEHVPDLITWLGEMQDCLRPGGQLRLVLPDRRFSFDYFRAGTTITELIAAYLLRARRPQMREVLDFYLHYAPKMDGWGVYEGRFDPTTVEPAFSVEQASRIALRAHETDVYEDVHCWVFSPLNFAALMQRLAKYGLLRMACAGFTDASYPLMEFYPIFEPCDNQAEVVASWRDIQTKLFDPLPGSAAALLINDAGTAATSTYQVQQLEQSLLAYQARVNAMEASKSWRITAPLRALKRWSNAKLIKQVVAHAAPRNLQADG